MTDSEKLRALSRWFDAYHFEIQAAGIYSSGLEKDLRAIADRIDESKIADKKVLRIPEILEIIAECKRRPDCSCVNQCELAIEDIHSSKNKTPIVKPMRDMVIKGLSD